MSYYERNREKCKQYALQNARDNKERRLLYSKVYYSKNIEVCKQYQKQYHNLQYVKQKAKLYYLANKDKFIINNLKSRQKLKKSLYDSSQKYYLKCLMKLPDAFKKQRKRNKKKTIVKKLLKMELTIYFD